jgi:hypothetical protein
MSMPLKTMILEDCNQLNYFTESLNVKAQTVDTHREAYSLYVGCFVNHSDKTPTREQLECMVTCIMGSN